MAFTRKRALKPDGLDVLICFAGVAHVISLIRTRLVVVKLDLSHNELGDEGCIALFDYLSSDEGRKYNIQEISLNSNGVGDRGLHAIACYLCGNRNLKSLFLQNNVFPGHADTVIAFVEALNTSNIETLSFTTNRQLSDPFISYFLPNLDAPRLRELHLSLMELSHISTPIILSYISSRRCLLRTLKLNGNNLGFDSVRLIVHDVGKHNFNLTGLELSSNIVPGDPEHFETVRRESERELRGYFLRNEYLVRAREQEALFLLCHSRLLFLRTKTDDATQSQPSSSLNHSLFEKLPVELQLYILSFLGPHLSNMQRIRIFTYASDPGTLPQLPHLNPDTLACIPDPAGLQFSNGTVSCGSGACWGAGNSLQCRKEVMRTRLLEQVGCVMYEPL